MDKIVILFIMIPIKSDGQHDLFNLALRKRIYLSSIGDGCEPRYAVDGNYGLQACADKSKIDQWLTVDLGRPYQIDHLQMVSQTDMTENLVGLLHNFHIITKEKKMNHTITCTLVGKAESVTILTAEAKFECKDKEEYYRYVTVQQTSASHMGLIIHELQVLGKYVEYTGCYKEIKADNVNEDHVDVITCQKNCKKQRNLYAAIKNGTMCFCGDDIKGSQPLSKCDIFCDNAIDYCGGQNQFSVYFVFPYKPLERTNREYIGCYTNHNRDLFYRPLVDVDHCHKFCAFINQHFFGLQVIKMNGGECQCDIKYGSYSPVHESYCNMTCEVTRSQLCGGHNINSVYSITVKVGGFNFRRCKNGEKPDVYDICKECDDGWTGESCSIRDCSKNNGDCKSHKCVSTLLYRQNVSECMCYNGFSKLSWSEDCQDVDECSDICKLDGARCYNTIGSYYCFCLNTGMKYDSTTDTCNDVDECDDTSLCKFDNARCYNTIGSYNCTCLNDGMKYDFITDTCNDVDECIDTSMCKSDGAQCYNTIGSYNCICSNDGMKYNFTTETCDDVDECDNTSSCKLEVTKCYNTIGSYSCVCLDDGMDYDIITETCNDVDECFIETDLCNSKDVRCLNTFGSYKCICLQNGMIFDSSKKKCRDIDECTDNTSICNPRVAKCSNVIGSFSCTCLEVGMRYNLTTKTCKDIDECDNEYDFCNDEVASCSNTIGSYECICLEDDLLYDSISETCNVPYKATTEVIIRIFTPILVVILAMIFITIISVTGQHFEANLL